MYKIYVFNGNWELVDVTMNQEEVDSILSRHEGRYIVIKMTDRDEIYKTGINKPKERIK